MRASVSRLPLTLLNLQDPSAPKPAKLLTQKCTLVVICPRPLGDETILYCHLTPGGALLLPIFLDPRPEIVSSLATKPSFLILRVQLSVDSPFIPYSSPFLEATYFVPILLIPLRPICSKCFSSQFLPSRLPFAFCFVTLVTHQFVIP